MMQVPYGYEAGGAEEEDDDMYSGFNSNVPFPIHHTRELPPGSAVQEVPTSSAYWNNAPLPTGMNQVDEEARPTTMASVRAAGYTSAPKTSKFDPLFQGKTPAIFEEKIEQTPEQVANEMEKKVNRLLEASSQLNLEERYSEALDKAKEATKREAALSKHLEQSGLKDQINADLKYSVAFNLAVQYESNRLHTEALNTYSLIVKNRYYLNAGRLRVNMGNIYYRDKKYTLAIKMYKMALDRIPNNNKETRFKIMRNIGHALVSVGQYQEAVQVYEAIMEEFPDIHTGFNLILCYYALGEKDKMKKAFVKLLGVRVESDADDLDEVETDIDDEESDKERPEVLDMYEDNLRRELRQKRAKANEIIMKAARLIAGMIEKDWESGYDYVIEQLKYYEVKYPNSQLSSEMEMTKALAYLKHKHFNKAIEALKAFEKKDKKFQARAATNISYLYMLEDDLKNCEKYAQMGVEADKYNAKALVNLGNSHFSKKEYPKAKELYLQAIEVESDCVEALYNYGLVCKVLEDYDLAMQAFRRLLTHVPKNVEVTFQIACLHETVGDYEQAADWFSRVATLVPTDPGVLAKLGDIYAREDESQAIHYHLESYRLYPVDIEVISRLGAYYVNNEIYEQALVFFERASHIQPGEAKWQLLKASCYRKTGNYQQAKTLYEQIHRKHPDNIECLRYLYRICNYLGQTDDVRYYHKQLTKLEAKSVAPSRAGSAVSQTTLNSETSNSETESIKVSFAPPSEKSIANLPTRPSSNKTEPASDNNGSEYDDNDDYEDLDLGDDLLPM